MWAHLSPCIEKIHNDSSNIIISIQSSFQWSKKYLHILSEGEDLHK